MTLGFLGPGFDRKNRFWRNDYWSIADQPLNQYPVCSLQKLISVTCSYIKKNILHAVKIKGTYGYTFAHKRQDEIRIFIDDLFLSILLRMCSEPRGKKGASAEEENQGESQSCALKAKLIMNSICLKLIMHASKSAKLKYDVLLWKCRHLMELMKSL